MRRKTALRLVKEEIDRAQSQFPPMNSAHEAYAVLKEEVDELWAEVKAGNGTGHHGVSEAVQTAAMAIRYLLDLCDDASANDHQEKIVSHQKEVIAEQTPRTRAYHSGGGFGASYSG